MITMLDNSTVLRRMASVLVVPILIACMAALCILAPLLRAGTALPLMLALLPCAAVEWIARGRSRCFEWVRALDRWVDRR